MFIRAERSIELSASFNIALYVPKKKKAYGDIDDKNDDE